MAFRMPNWSDLTDDQRMVINLPLNKTNLVYGAPGTGKTVVALMRIEKLANAGKKVLLLVYNRPLKLYLESAVSARGISASVYTWMAWIDRFYKEHKYREHPRADEKEKFSYDWPQILSDFRSIGFKYDHIIIDEAQDLPRQLIEALLLISPTVSCLMDQNQMLQADGSTLSDLEEILQVRRAFSLHDNFRNPREIFDFASLYGVTEDAKAVRETGQKPRFIRCANESQIIEKLMKVLRQNYDLETIGILTDRDRGVELFNALSGKVKGMDVFIYQSNDRDRKQLDFDRPGVYILSYGTMKGLEFDAVILPYSGQVEYKTAKSGRTNPFYVAITRAHEKLYCFYDGATGNSCVDVMTPLEAHKDLVDWEE